MVTLKDTKPKEEVRKSKRNRGADDKARYRFDDQLEEDYKPIADTRKRKRIDITSNHPEDQATRPRFLPAKWNDEFDPAAPFYPTKHIHFLPGRHQYTPEGLHIDQQDYLVVRRQLLGTNHATNTLESRRIVQRFPLGLPRDWRDTETLRELNAWMYVVWFTPAKQHDWAEQMHTGAPSPLSAVGPLDEQAPESSIRSSPGGPPDSVHLDALKSSSSESITRADPHQPSQTATPMITKKPSLDTAPFPSRQDSAAAPSSSPSLPPSWPRGTPRPDDYKRTTTLIRHVPQYASTLWVLSTPLDNGTEIEHTVRDEYLKGWVGEIKWKKFHAEAADRDIEKEENNAEVKEFWKEYLEIIEAHKLGGFDALSCYAQEMPYRHMMVSKQKQKKAFGEDFKG